MPGGKPVVQGQTGVAADPVTQEESAQLEEVEKRSRDEYAGKAETNRERIVQHPVFTLAGFEENAMDFLLSYSEGNDIIRLFKNIKPKYETEKIGPPIEGHERPSIGIYTDSGNKKHIFISLDPRELNDDGSGIRAYIENSGHNPNEFGSINIVLHIGNDHWGSVHIPTNGNTIECWDPFGNNSIPEKVQVALLAAFPGKSVVLNQQRLQEAAGPCGVFAGMNCFKNVFLLEMEELKNKIEALNARITELENKPSQEKTVADEIEEIEKRKEMEEKSARLSELLKPFRTKRGEKSFKADYVRGPYIERFENVLGFKQSLSPKKKDTPIPTSPRRRNIKMLSKKCEDLHRRVAAMKAFEKFKNSIPAEEIEGYVGAKLYITDGKWHVQFEMPGNELKTYRLDGDTLSRLETNVSVEITGNTLKVKEGELPDVSTKLSQLETDLGHKEAGRLSMEEHVAEKAEKYKNKFGPEM